MGNYGCYPDCYPLGAPKQNPLVAPKQNWNPSSYHIDFVSNKHINSQIYTSFIFNYFRTC